MGIGILSDDFHRQFPYLSRLQKPCNIAEIMPICRMILKKRVEHEIYAGLTAELSRASRMGHMGSGRTPMKSPKGGATMGLRSEPHRLISVAPQRVCPIGDTRVGCHATSISITMRWSHTGLIVVTMDYHLSLIGSSIAHHPKVCAS